jgi:HAD superfamily hydrolase (TIGR01509 family)
LLSNNPAPLLAALPQLAPDIVEILGENILVSFMLDSRKPSATLFERAMARYGASPESTFLADDSLENVLGARAVGITAHRLDYVGDVPQTAELMVAVEAFASRERS